MASSGTFDVGMILRFRKATFRIFLFRHRDHEGLCNSERITPDLIGSARRYAARECSRRLTELPGTHSQTTIRVNIPVKSLHVTQSV